MGFYKILACLAMTSFSFFVGERGHSTKFQDAQFFDHSHTPGSTLDMSPYCDGRLFQRPIPAPLGDPEEGWERIEIAGVGSIDLAPEIEIQGGRYRVQNARYKERMGEYLQIEFGQPKLTLQPKGINDFDQQALGRYMRVLVETMQGNAGDFSKIHEPIDLSESDLREFNVEVKNQTLLSFRKMGMRLIDWDPVQVVELNNMPAIRIAYTRQLKDQPHVRVENYRIQNHDRIHSLTLSYRISEGGTWKPLLKQTKASFRITDIRG